MNPILLDWLKIGISSGVYFLRPIILHVDQPTWAPGPLSSSLRYSQNCQRNRPVTQWRLTSIPNSRSEVGGKWNNGHHSHRTCAKCARKAHWCGAPKFWDIPVQTLIVTWVCAVLRWAWQFLAGLPAVELCQVHLYKTETLWCISILSREANMARVGRVLKNIYLALSLARSAH